MTIIIGYRKTGQKRAENVFIHLDKMPTKKIINFVFYMLKIY